MSNYLFVKYLLISKQTGTQVEPFKTLIFGGSICQFGGFGGFKKLILGGFIWGGPGGVAPPNYVKIFVS